MKKGFTLIELLVAMAVLALMIAFASMVFTVSIDTYRTSMATAEIMQKLRVVTDQLDADFKGIRRDAPLLIWFEPDSANPDIRHDQIMSFADGDFSSIQLYDTTTGHPAIATSSQTTVIRGNTARIYYGPANTNAIARNRILARRQHILDPCDTNVEAWPDINLTNLLSDLGNPDSDPNSGQTKEDRYEHDILSLTQWKIIDSTYYADSKAVINPDGSGFSNRPIVDTGDSRTFHKLLCEGVSSFTIQWAYWDNLPNKARFYWFPSDNPDGDDTTSDTHFTGSLGARFGIYFNIPGSTDFSGNNWFTPGINNIVYRAGEPPFADNFFPTVLKFTFRLYDSKGVIRDGMEFSHIVYLEQ